MKYRYVFVYSLVFLVLFSNFSSILFLNDGQCIELFEKEELLSHKDISWHIISYVFGAYLKLLFLIL